MPFNGIILVPRETDSIIQMITLTEETLWLAYCKKAKQGLEFKEKLKWASTVFRKYFNIF
jgi:hypothetical protein